VATAFDGEGNESAYSNEVTTIIKPKPPTPMPAVQAVLTAPVRAVRRFVSLFRDRKQFGIVK
jgi:hypothetical protein